MDGSPENDKGVRILGRITYHSLARRIADSSVLIQFPTTWDFGIFNQSYLNTEGEQRNCSNLSMCFKSLNANAGFCRKRPHGFDSVFEKGNMGNFDKYLNAFTYHRNHQPKYRNFRDSEFVFLEKSGLTYAIIFLIET